MSMIENGRHHDDSNQADHHFQCHEDVLPAPAVEGR